CTPARLDFPVATTERVIAEDAIRVLDHGFVRLDGSMATDLSVVNAARVSFARRKEEMDEGDEGLIRFLMRDRHGTPFEHNSFRAAETAQREIRRYADAVEQFFAAEMPVTHAAFVAADRTAP